jgi:hypothetical protein
VAKSDDAFDEEDRRMPETATAADVWNRRCTIHNSLAV